MSLAPPAHAAITNRAVPQISGGSALARYIAVIWKTLVIAGGLAVLFYLTWAALDWIFSGSEPERLKRAKDKMFNAILGLTLLLLSYLIIKIINLLTGFNILYIRWPSP